MWESRVDILAFSWPCMNESLNFLLLHMLIWGFLFYFSIFLLVLYFLSFCLGEVILFIYLFFFKWFYGTDWISLFFIPLFRLFVFQLVSLGAMIPWINSIFFNHILQCAGVYYIQQSFFCTLLTIESNHGNVHYCIFSLNTVFMPVSSVFIHSDFFLFFP